MPSGQYIRSNRIVTTTIWKVFIMMNSRPNPRKRRTVDRSFMMRLSN